MGTLLTKLLSFIKKNYRWLVAVYFSILGLYLRYKDLARRDLWNDEIYQLNQTLGEFKPFWNRMPYVIDMTCFRGDYFLTYPFAQIFDSNKWGLAIPHIIATIIGFYFFYLICNRYLKTVLGFTISFFFICFNHNLIFHAFELRPYAVLPTLALAVFYFSDMIVCHANELNRLKKFLIGIFFILTVAYHVYGLMIIFFCMLFFVLSETGHKSYKDILRNILPFSITFAFVAVPLFLWHFLDSVIDYGSSQGRNINTFDVITNPIVNFDSFYRTIFSNLLGYKKFKSKLLAYGIGLSFLIPHEQRRKQIGFFLILIIIPLELICLADLHSGYWFLDRQFVWIMPLYILLVGWCWDSVIVYLSGKLSISKLSKLFKKYKTT